MRSLFNAAIIGAGIIACIAWSNYIAGEEFKEVVIEMVVGAK